MLSVTFSARLTSNEMHTFFKVFRFGFGGQVVAVSTSGLVSVQNVDFPHLTHHEVNLPE